MPTGQELADKAASCIKDKYGFVLVPKRNPNWSGPWDCAELVSWAVYQLTGRLYGCVDNSADPNLVEAYSGSWVDDARKHLTRTDITAAMTIPGVILTRVPGMHGLRYGHVAISDGKGRVIEAAGMNLGVRRGNLAGRPWDFFSLIPEIQYDAPAVPAPPAPPEPVFFRLADPWTKHPTVEAAQRALKRAGFDPGAFDGAYGPNTAAAVVAFQLANRLVADGILGAKTAERLGLKWKVTA